MSNCSAPRMPKMDMMSSSCWPSCLTAMGTSEWPVTLPWQSVNTSSLLPNPLRSRLSPRGKVLVTCTESSSTEAECMFWGQQCHPLSATYFPIPSGLIRYNISNFNLIAKLIIQGSGGVEDFEIMCEPRLATAFSIRSRANSLLRWSIS